MIKLHITLVTWFTATVAFALPPVNITDRTAVIDYYRNYYCPEEKAKPEWSGNIESGQAGLTGEIYNSATFQRINFFRALAGVSSEITSREDWAASCREAALMMSAANQLSHFPATTWQFYSQSGAVAAANSNLSLGVAGPSAITGLMRDDGANNAAVGHRRWLLHPVATEMGFGAVVPKARYLASTAVWVIQDNPATSVSRNFGVAWPPAGYVPFPFIFDRWSFSFPEADFSAAQVSVTKNGAPVPVTLEPLSDGAGDNTIVWRVSDQSVGKAGPDITYGVTIANVSVNGGVQQFSYQVIQIDGELPLAQAKLQVTLGAYDRATKKQAFTMKAINKLGCEQANASQLQLLWASTTRPTKFRVLTTVNGSSSTLLLSGAGIYKAKLKGTKIESKSYQFTSGKGLRLARKR